MTNLPHFLLVLVATLVLAAKAFAPHQPAFFHGLVETTTKANAASSKPRVVPSFLHPMAAAAARISTPTTTTTALCMGEGDDVPDDKSGADLAAEFFKLAQQKGINLSADELDDDEDDDDEEDEDIPVTQKKGGNEEKEDDDEDDDDEAEINYPQGAINAFLGYDTGNVGEKLAGNVSLTDNQLYSEVKERVLDTAGGFVEYVKRAQEDDDDNEDEDDDDDDRDAVIVGEMGKSELLIDESLQKPYEPPTTVPDPELTAGEVVMLVLQALLHNDVPTPNRGVEIFFGFSSASSQVKTEPGLTPAEYAEFLKEETEYKVLFDNQGATIDKGDYSFDGKKAFFTARLKTGPGPLDSTPVNFILSTTGVEDDACWLIDSMLIRPSSMRRRRRR